MKIMSEVVQQKFVVNLEFEYDAELHREETHPSKLKTLVSGEKQFLENYFEKDFQDFFDLNYKFITVKVTPVVGAV